MSIIKDRAISARHAEAMESKDTFMRVAVLASLAVVFAFAILVHFHS
ncbi:MAG TPA: hypothetical protein VF848_08935 [Steroidobacteraceae bacterium]